MGKCVRWEMRTRLFLRTAEFLWQEGHTLMQPKKKLFKKQNKCLMSMQVCGNNMAIPVIKGVKSENERFGAKKLIA